MKKEGLKQRLLKYLRTIYPQTIAKGELCDIARQVTGATGEHTGRRLRELETAELIKVTYFKGHAHYQALPPKVSEPIFAGGVNTGYTRTIW